MASDLFGFSRYFIFEYVDELFCAICLMLLLIKIIRTKKIHKIYLYLIILLVLGVLGNVFYGIQTQWNIIAEDAFIFCKPYILMLYVIANVKEFQVKKLYMFFMTISKILIIIISFFSVLSLFVDLNMRNEDGNFKFLNQDRFTGQVCMWSILFLAIIISDKKNHRTFYYILCAIVVIMADSGLGIISLFGLLAIYIFLEKMKKFKWYYLLFIIPIGLIVGRNEIMGYLLNSNAPRFLLFYYSFFTAFRFFPLGSGFATYASAMANKVYSQLYYEYDFNNNYGMSFHQRYYLMDSYYPQIIAQFGVIGMLIYGYFMLYIFKNIIWKEKNRNIRNANIYIFATWAIAGLGFGVSGSWGCAIYLIISLLYLLDKTKVDINCKAECP